jgi:hypothetical protein
MTAVIGKDGDSYSTAWHMRRGECVMQQQLTQMAQASRTLASKTDEMAGAEGGQC